MAAEMTLVGGVATPHGNPPLPLVSVVQDVGDINVK
jgi:hypothetical protein